MMRVTYKKAIKPRTATAFTSKMVAISLPGSLKRYEPYIFKAA